MSNPPPKEDKWAFGPIGSPFPDNPVRVLGQPNMSVALWYKYDVPMHGRARNNGGVLECSFSYKKAELAGIKDLDGQIQVLQYKGDHNTLGFWYEWIKYKDRFEKADIRQIVHCGASIPILWKNRPEGALLAESSGSITIIVRNTKGGPPTCGCKHCHKPPPPCVMIDEWINLRASDPWPKDKKLNKALNKNLNIHQGENSEQYVALWYQQGEPVMGRIWNDNDWLLQVLVELLDFFRGYDYDWKLFSFCASFGEKEWFPVYVIVKVLYHRSFLFFQYTYYLNVSTKFHIRSEKASAAFGGKEHILVGPSVQNGTLSQSRLQI
uniref:Uncharacterized protein n=1 Tax=Wuchereria bancrofti TaxID=6293 RepID=A0AAF5RY17_WUCBA